MNKENSAIVLFGANTNAAAFYLQIPSRCDLTIAATGAGVEYALNCGLGCGRLIFVVAFGLRRFFFDTAK